MIIYDYDTGWCVLRASTGRLGRCGLESHGVDTAPNIHENPTIPSTELLWLSQRSTSAKYESETIEKY